MSYTKIDWCDETVNVFTGCRGPHGKPCDFCYARKMARRLGGIKGTVYQRTRYATSETGTLCDHGDPFTPAIHLDVLERQEGRLSRGHKRVPSRNPRRIFVGSMGDMCFKGKAVTFDTNGERVPENCDWNSARLQRELADFAHRIAPHTVLLLTKRPDLLRHDVNWPGNVHLGVSVCGNEDAAIRIPKLLEVAKGCVLPWVSVEPLTDYDFDPSLLAGVKWVVVGVQTGQGARMNKQAGLSRMHGELQPITVGEALYESAERIDDWCWTNKVPLFVKSALRKIEHHLRPQMDWPREYPEVGR